MTRDAGRALYIGQALHVRYGVQQRHGIGGRCGHAQRISNLAPASIVFDVGFVADQQYLRVGRQAAGVVGERPVQAGMSRLGYLAVQLNRQSGYVAGSGHVDRPYLLMDLGAETVRLGVADRVQRCLYRGCWRRLASLGRQTKSKRCAADQDRGNNQYDACMFSIHRRYSNQRSLVITKLRLPARRSRWPIAAQSLSQSSSVSTSVAAASSSGSSFVAPWAT